MSSFAPPCLHVLTLGVRSSLVFLWVPPRIYSHPLTRIAGKQIWGTFWSPDSRPNALPPAPNTHILMRSFRPGRETISFAWTLSTLVPLWAGRWQEVIEVIECLTGDQNKWNGALYPALRTPARRGRDEEGVPMGREGGNDHSQEARSHGVGLHPLLTGRLRNNLQILVEHLLWAKEWLKH